MIVRIKKSLADYRIHHINMWREFMEGEPIMNDINSRVKLLSIFTGVSIKELKEVDFNQIDKMYYELQDTIARHVMKEPKKYWRIGYKTFLGFKYGGRKFKFNKDIGSYSTGQIADIKTIDGGVASNPYIFLASIYIENGKKYNPVDAEKNQRLFREQFPADEFVNVLDFFLSNYERRKTAILAIAMVRERMQTKIVMKDLKEAIQSMSGQRTST